MTTFLAATDVVLIVSVIIYEYALSRANKKVDAALEAGWSAVRQTAWAMDANKKLVASVVDEWDWPLAPDLDNQFSTSVRYAKRAMQRMFTSMNQPL